MKEFILLNYNLKIEKIYNDFFFIDDNKIKILKCNKEIKDLEKLFILSNDLYYKQIPIDTFILNKEGNFYTKKNNENIILLKVNDIEDTIDLNYIKQFDIFNNLEYKNIIKTWEEEIDGFEEKLVEFNKEYEIVQKTANYYIGMAENAISLLNETKEINNNSIGIKISPLKLNKNEMNNPFNYFKINKMYNIANYIKNKILTNRVDYNELDQIIQNIENDINEISLFSYLLYPDYYFELITQMNEKKIKSLIKIIPVYEKVLKYLKENMYKNDKLKLFVWLN